jgi:hypothetical protein
MKNIQIIDGADDATYSIFQASDEEFEAIFPVSGQDIEVTDDYVSRVGEDAANRTLSKVWERPIHKRDVQGIHGTLFFDYKERSRHLPESKREIDRSASQVNEAEPVLYAKMRSQER